MKTLHTVVAVVGIALASGAAWWYQNKRASDVSASAAAAAPTPQRPGATAASGGAPVVVEAAPAEKRTLTEETSAVGTLRARQGVIVRPEVSGRIVTLGFIDGQPVRRGQVLVQLDDTLQQAQLQQAQAQAGIARTNLQRNRELVAQGFVSQSAVDQSAAALEVAQAQVALAQAQLARMKVVAPFDGVAGIRSVHVGDYVKDGADVVSVEDLSRMWVDFRLAERFIAQVKRGQSVEVTLDAMPSQRFTGVVDALDSLLDADGRSLLVRARLDNPAGQLKTGMFARTRTVFAQRAGAIVVPEEALVPIGGKQFLIQVVEGPDGAKVSRRLEAKIGLRLPGKVEILEGLSAGDVVVTAGQASLLRADGLRVRIVEVGGSVGPRSANAASRAGAPA